MRANTKNVTGYRFIDKDPMIDLWREAKRISGLSNSQIASKSGVTAGTLLSWDKGKTRRPQNLTMAFAIKACGFKHRGYENADGRVIRAPNLDKRS